MLLWCLVHAFSSALVVQTWFVPDESWQSTEVAWSMLNRTSLITWEWQPHVAIRSVLVPAWFAAAFKAMSVMGVEGASWYITVPRLMQSLLLMNGK